MDASELDEVLEELRRFGTDTQDVEAKRANAGLPSTTSQTLSAFGNSTGGLYLLGVHEDGGAFAVTGVGDVARTMTALQTEFAEMDPPIRAFIEIIEHPDGHVIAAQVPPVARSQRPAHRRPTGPLAGSYIRVGDGDQQLSESEVTAMIAARSTDDASAVPVDGALDGALVAQFADRVRAGSARDGLDDDTILRSYGALAEDGRPTVGGLLVLGEDPQQVSAAARLTYRSTTVHGGPAGTRHSGGHLEGTVGYLLEGTMAWLASNLNEVQVERDGAVFDESDVPRIALRELLSNALIHRSLTVPLLEASVTVEVNDEVVSIESPGGIHAATDPSTLGMLGAVAGVRNLTLVRIAELTTTPYGNRIVEQQNMGIRTADEACRTAGLMPPLFSDLPSCFRVLVLRSPLDTGAAADRLTGTALEKSADAARLVAAAGRIADIAALPASASLRRVVLDARFAARVLAPSSPEDAAALLKALTDAGVLERTASRATAAWRLPPAEQAETTEDQAAAPAEPDGRTGDRVPEILDAIAAHPEGAMSPKDIADVLGLRSPRSRNRWIRSAESKGLIEATNPQPFASNQTYVLTDKGRAVQKLTAPDK